MRSLAIATVAPGLTEDAGLPDEARFSYQEWWRSSSLGWVRVRYDYDYLDLVHGGHRGYHLHPLRAESTPHAVCVTPDGTGEGRHYDAHEVDLLAVHDEFEAQYAAALPIDCRGLRPID